MCMHTHNSTRTSIWILTSWYSFQGNHIYYQLREIQNRFYRLMLHTVIRTISTKIPSLILVFIIDCWAISIPYGQKTNGDRFVSLVTRRPVIGDERLYMLWIDKLILSEGESRKAATATVEVNSFQQNIFKFRQQWNKQKICEAWLTFIYLLLSCYWKIYFFHSARNIEQLLSMC